MVPICIKDFEISPFMCTKYRKSGFLLGEYTTPLFTLQTICETFQNLSIKNILIHRQYSGKVLFTYHKIAVECIKPETVLQTKKVFGLHDTNAYMCWE